MCLDESAVDVATVRRALGLGSCSVVNIKIQRVGGLKNAIAVHDLCAAADVAVWAGTMPELGIGSAQALHLALLPNFRFPTDVQSSLRWFVDDIIEPMISVVGGDIEIPAGVGLGYKINHAVMRKYLLREEWFGR